MPGKTVVEFAPNPQAELLVGALGDLAANASAKFVLVGGLAVAARLKTFHRATLDLDAVVAQERSRFQEVMVEAISSARVDSGHLTISDVVVDIIDIDEDVTFDQIAALGAPLDRLFTAGHLFAFRDASNVELRVGGAHAGVQIALARALLVSKLHAYLSRRRDPRKSSSDAIDVLELTRLLIAQPGIAYGSDVPDSVRASCRWGIEQIAGEPAEMVRRLSLMGFAVRAEEVLAVMTVLLEDLRS